jgi:DNA methyltransferase 1-associated protein 1
MITTSSLGPSSGPIPYTNTEYEEHLRSEEWTREETDYLFGLCQDFNYRLVIVVDRYGFPSTNRSLEDIRERYYEVTGKLSTIRTGDRQQFVYDKEGDRHRRLKLAALSTRDSEQIREEALLAEIMSQMRISLPLVVTEREKLLICCGGLGQNVLAHAPTMPELIGAGRNRRGSVENRPNKSSHKQSGSGRKADTKRRRPSAVVVSEGENEVYDVAHAGPGRKPKPAMANTTVRSAMLRPIRVGLTRQVDKILLEMGLRKPFISY